MDSPKTDSPSEGRNYQNTLLFRIYTLDPSLPIYIGACTGHITGGFLNRLSKSCNIDPHLYKVEVDKHIQCTSGLDMNKQLRLYVEELQKADPRIQHLDSIKRPHTRQPRHKQPIMPSSPSSSSSDDSITTPVMLELTEQNNHIKQLENRVERCEKENQQLREEIKELREYIKNIHKQEKSHKEKSHKEKSSVKSGYKDESIIPDESTNKKKYLCKYHDYGCMEDFDTYQSGNAHAGHCPYKNKSKDE